MRDAGWAWTEHKWGHLANGVQRAGFWLSIQYKYRWVGGSEVVLITGWL